MHDHPLGLGVADVVEQAVAPAGALGEAVHRRLHDARAGVVEGVGGLAGLEEDVGVLGGAAQHRAVGRQGPARGGRATASSSRSGCAGRRRSSASIFATSCEVRKPSKKCRNGTRDSSVAAWAISGQVVRLLHRVRARAARSRSGGRPSRPSGRRRSTGRGWRAVRAATCMQKGVSSPAILYMLGIISSRPCEAVKVVASAPGLQRAVDGARRAAPPTASPRPRARRPRGSCCPSAAHSSHQLAHRSSWA